MISSFICNIMIFYPIQCMVIRIADIRNDKKIIRNCIQSLISEGHIKEFIINNYQNFMTTS